MLNRLLFLLGSTFGHLALHLLARTWRLRVFGAAQALKEMDSRTPLMMITWHGRLLVSTWHMRGRGMVTMISRHRDGELVARVVQKLGYITARGSSTRGGTQAALEMIDEIKLGRTAAMICDGPRGPIYKMKLGAPFLAMQARANVMPVIFAADRAWVFKSWDRFTVPKPFARVHLYYGDVILAPEGNDVKSFARVLEGALNQLLAKAEADILSPRRG